MDALVAQYSRQPDQREAQTEAEDDLKFAAISPPLSLKFALPPVANVSELSVTVFKLAPPLDHAR